MQLPASIAIVRGSILNTSFEGIDHKKMFVIIGENDKSVFGFFFINSNINKYIQDRQVLLDMQCILKRANYPDILEYDSFLDCHEIKTFDKQTLIAGYDNGTIAHIGNLIEDDIEIVLSVCRNSPLFSEYEKRTFLK
ncbi:MAG: hypothetical protein IK025_03265 [Bacteroidales bacterium]|nr:hypothetical protein [Bacteroidales bacterium]